jgi:hypothetical protein
LIEQLSDLSRQAQLAAAGLAEAADSAAASAAPAAAGAAAAVESSGGAAGSDAGVGKVQLRAVQLLT